VRAREVSVRELVELSLARLERLDPVLTCVVTLLPERALARADALDRALAEDPGAWSGPLFGIPFGAKDLFAARGGPTSWGSPLCREQVFDFDATAIERLEAAGAVLVAKLSLGELAWGDEWFGGTTKNPWKPEQGSSGSSAGSASAVAAGCVPFALGTETLGSIVSPAQRCGASGLRPSFGRVSRHGAMTLSWSMDKVGVLARSAVDCGIVLAALAGPDGRDPSVVERPLGRTAAAPLAGRRIGRSEAAFAAAGEAERAVLAELERLGAELVPFEAPELPLEALLVTLEVEAAAAFDELVRTGREEELVRQGEQAWPNVMRRAQLVPAVDYLRAQRLRTEACLALGRALEGLDLVVHPPYAEGLLGATNLTGQPSLTVPCGFRDDGTPIGISFTANLYDETRLVALVAAWQEASGHHRRHPDL
jgi:Asp-tRNA(Asn)/Glu-tRNA(Gln) amidotransferase A subunit family amidase